jgi:hypothetical protein
MCLGRWYFRACPIPILRGNDIFIFFTLINLFSQRMHKNLSIADVLNPQEILDMRVAAMACIDIKYLLSMMQLHFSIYHG